MAKRASRRKIKLESALNAVDSPVFLVDAERRIVFINEGCQQLTRWEPADVAGVVCEFNTAGEADSLEVLGGTLCPPQDVLDGMPASVARYFVNRETGDSTSLMVSFYPLLDADEVAFVIGIATTIPKASRNVDTSIVTQVHAELAALRHELRQRYGADSILFRSAAMRRVVDQVKVAQQSRGSVYIHGEAGTGKEHIARVIHYASDLGQRAFVPIQCRLLPANDLREAIRRLVETDWADLSQIAALQPGCIYLEDVDSLPREIQQRLVDFLESPAGTTFRSNVRLTSSSRASLDELQSAGQLVDEFFFAITSLEIRLSPLCDRMEDVRVLAQHFLEQRNRDRHRQITGFSNEVWKLFEEYNWPGNLDELDEVIAEAVETCDSPTIRLDQLPFRFRTGLDAQHLGPTPDGPMEPLEQLLKRVEREQIEQALERARDNKAKAARLLGITRPALYRRMESLGMTEEH